jgi:hypothetical protein
MHAKNHEEKKRKKEKKEIKIAHTFKSEALIQKERDSWFKGIPKIFRIGTLRKFHTLARLDQSVWLASPCGLVFDLAKYVMQVCSTFIPTQNSTQKHLVGGYEKEGK